MKVLFISDIHGIKTNIELVSKKYNDLKCDKLVVLGDLYYLGPGRDTSIGDYDNKCVLDFLNGFGDDLICLRGNCDSDVDIKASDFPICSDLALIAVDGLNLYLTHGNLYNMENNRKFNIEGILIYGHEHIPFIKKDDRMTYINTGSISLPKNGFKPSYMIYENKLFTIYDVDDNIIDQVQF